MTHPAKTALEALLIDIRSTPEITPAKAIAAIILITRQLKLGISDFREMNGLMRTEFGWPSAKWNDLVVGMLAQFSELSRGYTEDLTRSE